VSLPALRDQRQRPPHGWAGTILDTATSLQDEVRVRLDAFGDSRRYHGPMPFLPGAVLPAEGDRCVVLFDESRQPCVVWWATSAALPAVGAPSNRTASRALNTVYQPDTTRPTFVTCSIKIDCDPSDHGRVWVQVEDANPPTVAAAEVADQHGAAAGNTLLTFSASVIVPAGWRYRIATSSVAGTPTFALVSVFEWAL
jgi:hypothetical protein